MSALLLSTLGVVCPTCDQYNPPQSTKCADCGSPLGGPAPKAAPAIAPVTAAPQPPSAKAAVAPSPVPPPASPPPPVAKAQAPAPQPVRPVPLGDSPVPKTDSHPPGMRPAARPLTPAAHPVAPVSSSQIPIPASELVKKPSQPISRPGTPTPSRFGLSVVAGQGAGQRFRLGGAGCMVGRSRGAILFPDDPFVAAHHGTFILRDGKLFVRDEGSASGVYVSVTSAPEPLPAGGYFAAGGRCFRYAGALPRPTPPQPGQPQVYGAPVPPGQVLYALEEIIVGGRAGRAVITAGPLLTIGQTHCDFVYPNDPYLAPRHCEVSPTLAGATLRDLSGGLGTFIRLLPGAERPLNAGDRVRIGQQILQVETIG